MLSKVKERQEVKGRRVHVIGRGAKSKKAKGFRGLKQGQSGWIVEC